MTDVGVVISLTLAGGMVVSAVLVAFALRQVRQFCGPLNLPPVHSSGGSRRLAVVVLGASPACAVLGFVVAYFWSSGSLEERLEYGLFAAFGGWLIGYVLVMIWRVTHAVRALGKSK